MTKLEGTNTFKLAAVRLQEIKLFLHKQELIDMDILAKTRSYAEGILGSDLTLLEDRKTALPYLRDRLGKYFLYLFDDDSDIALDHEHMILLLNKFKSASEEDKRKAKVDPRMTVRDIMALAYYYGGKQLAMEFEEIKKVAVKNYISPAFELNPQTYKWKRCPHVLRQYMLHFTRPPGYNVYEYEYPNLASIYYLVHRGMFFAEAEDHLRRIKVGLFYPFLPLEVENRMLYAVLGGRFANMSGQLADDYEQDVRELSSTFIFSDQNIFNVCVQPAMIEKMGQVMSMIQSSIKARLLTSNTDVYFYHVSPYRLGLAVKDNLNINEVLPAYADRQNNDLKYLTPVPRPNIANLISGLHL